MTLSPYIYAEKAFIPTTKGQCIQLCYFFLTVFFFLQANSLHADEKIDFSLSGFGTLAYTISDNDEVAFRRGLGADGADSSGTLKTDSRLGMQLNANFDEHLSATLQGVLRQNADGNIRPQAEWAYLKAQINDTFAFRMGRMTDPLFMYSEVREVGFAHTTIRLPENVYGQSPIANFDGIDLMTTLEFGGAMLSTRLYAGGKKFRIPDLAHFEAKDMHGISFDIDYELTHWRLGYTRSDLKLTAPYREELGQQLTNLAIIYPELLPFALDLEPRAWPFEVFNIGVKFDLSPWQLSTEWLQLKSTALISHTTAWHVTLARRFDQITPYVSISENSQKMNAEVPDLGVPLLAPVIAATQLVFAPRDQSTIALGMRWDFAPNVNFKAQLEHIKRTALGSSFTTTGDPTAPTNNDDVQLLTVGLDFIF